MRRSCWIMHRGLGARVCRKLPQRLHRILSQTSSQQIQEECAFSFYTAGLQMGISLWRTSPPMLDSTQVYAAVSNRENDWVHWGSIATRRDRLGSHWSMACGIPWIGGKYLLFLKHQRLPLTLVGYFLILPRYAMDFTTT